MTTDVEKKRVFLRAFDELMGALDQKVKNYYTSAEYNSLQFVKEQKDANRSRAKNSLLKAEMWEEAKGFIRTHVSSVEENGVWVRVMEDWVKVVTVFNENGKSANRSAKYEAVEFVKTMNNDHRVNSLSYMDREQIWNEAFDMVRRSVSSF